MSEGVPWTSNFQPGVPQNDVARAANLHRPPHPHAAGFQRFPSPFPPVNPGPGMNYGARQLNPGIANTPDKMIPSNIGPPTAVPNLSGSNSAGHSYPRYSSDSSASTPALTGSSVFSQTPSSATAINGPSVPPTMPTFDKSHQNPISQGSVFPSIPGVPNANNDSSVMHSSSGDIKLSHSLLSSNSPRSVASNDVSPTPSAGGLPLPYNGMAQYTHPIRHDGSHESSGAATPTHSNQRSYQPSPVSTPQIDAVEGQFSQKQFKQHPLQQAQNPPGHHSNPSSTTTGSANHSRSGSGASAGQFPPSLPGYVQPPGNTGAYQTGPPLPPTALSYQPTPPRPGLGGHPAPPTTAPQRFQGPSPLEPPNQPGISNASHLIMPPKREVSKLPTMDQMTTSMPSQPGIPPPTVPSGSGIMPPTAVGPVHSSASSQHHFNIFPPTGGPGMVPPPGTQMFPSNVASGIKPPPVGQVGFPTTRPSDMYKTGSHGIFPPSTNPGMLPPSGGHAGFTPAAGSGIVPPPVFPPSSNSGMIPPTGGHKGFPPTGGQTDNISGAPSNRMPPGSQVGPPPMPGPPSMRLGHAVNASPSSSLSTSFSKLNLGPNRIVNLLQERVLIPTEGIETVKPHFGSEYREHTTNCAPEIMRLTLNSLPQTSNLLNKARLPLGLHLHPFRDLSTIPVIQASVIVRCKSCRTYINPFVVFLDQRRWRCNICFRQNEVPNEFQFDPVSRQYGDPQRRPEVKSATVEFIAPSEYMLRPPQPAVYLFVLDVSRVALSTGYLPLFCHTLLDYLDQLPGDARTHIGLITFNTGLQFYKLDEERGPRMLVVNDIEDVFLPDHSGLVVNLGQHRETVEDLLNNLPESFSMDEASTGNCMGAALQAALKLVGPTGGRVTVVNCGLPNSGPGALKSREDPNQRAAPKSVSHLGPATDFYKSLALECAGQQVAVDLFLLTNAYTDLATILGISRHSGGGFRVYPNFGDENMLEMTRFRIDLRRYLSRKIGFEAVMRVRCTRGLAITAFYGNFFVRSTDLLSLPNVSPDAGYAMQIKIEDSLTDLASVSFQAALLYTSSKGERRIRVHTLTVPTTGVLEEVFRNADHSAVACLLAKMAAERSVDSGIREAREALVNAVLDVMKAYGDACLSSAQRIGSLGLPYNLRLLPLFVLSILKSRAYRLGVSTRLDDRVAMMEMFKTLPPSYLLPLIYPRLYALHGLVSDDGPEKPPQIHASAQFTERNGTYLMDAGEYLFLLVGRDTPQKFITDVFGVPGFDAIPDGATELPERETPTSEKLRAFVHSLRDERPIGMPLLVMRDDAPMRYMFSERMLDDRSDQLMAYTEFLQYLQSHVKYSSSN